MTSYSEVILWFIIDSIDFLIDGSLNEVIIIEIIDLINKESLIKNTILLLKMEMPLPEVLDRLSILKLKIERIGEPHLKDELNAYQEAINEFRNKKTLIRDEWLNKLYIINGKIWDLESDIRKGREGELGLEEVGRRAIAIRELNKQRVLIKNQIVQETGIGFKDVKMNHASQ